MFFDAYPMPIRIVFAFLISAVGVCIMWRGTLKLSHSRYVDRNLFSRWHMPNGNPVRFSALMAFEGILITLIGLVVVMAGLLELVDLLKGWHPVLLPPPTVTPLPSLG